MTWLLLENPPLTRKHSLLFLLFSAAIVPSIYAIAYEMLKEGLE
jgi:hypothetical protein